MVFIRNQIVDLKIALVRLVLKLLDVVGGGIEIVELGGHDIVGGVTESANRNLVIQERRARCRIGAGSRIVELLDRIVAMPSGKSCRANCGKVASSFCIAHGLKLSRGRRLRK